MRFNGTEITSETIERTRQHFADIDRQCIADAESGANPVNNVPGYVAWRQQAIADGMAGRYDHSLTFMQRAYWLQTGESVALLP